MWRCINCDAESMFEGVDLEVDSRRLHFLCPACGHPNTVIELRGAGDSLESGLPDDLQREQISPSRQRN